MRDIDMRFSQWTVLALATLLSACANGGSWVEVGGERFTVEIADDDAERARGLMFRDELATGTGMLFIHDAEEPQAYWMKNTLSLIHI